MLDMTRDMAMKAIKDLKKLRKECGECSEAARILDHCIYQIKQGMEEVPDDGLPRMLLLKIKRTMPASRWANEVQCNRMDCVHHDLPALGIQCGKVRPFIGKNGNCESYQKREEKVGF